MRRLLGLVVVALVAGCFSPKYAENLKCSSRNTCPPGFGCDPQGICQRNFTPDARVDAITEKGAEAPPSPDADAAEDSSSPDVTEPGDAADAADAGQADVAADAAEAGAADAPADKAEAGIDVAADLPVEKLVEAGVEAPVDLGVEVGPPPPGLIARWALGDEHTNGDTVPDLATADGAQNGVIIDNGAYMNTVKGHDGKANQALRNMGDDPLDDQYAYIKVQSLTSLPQSVTISAWVAFTVGNGNGLIAGLTHGPQLFMKDYYATVRVPLDNFNYDDARAPSSLKSNEFVHVAGVVSPSGPSNWKLDLYINGSLAMSKTVANSVAWTGNFDIFGMYGCTSQGCDDGFKGDLDDVRVYNKALSANEVLALYDAPTN